MKTHSSRPEKLRKGKSWMCKCQVINLYEAVQCKMIDVDQIKAAQKQEQAIERNRLEALGVKVEKPKREQFNSTKTERQERMKMLELFTGPLETK